VHLFEEVSNIPIERVKKSKASQNFAGMFQLAHIILLCDQVLATGVRQLMVPPVTGIS